MKCTITCAILLLSSALFAATHELPHIRSTINIYDGSEFEYEPGDTFCLPADTVTGGFRFNNFHGSAAAPLVFMNCGGRTLIEEPTYSGITFNGCQYIHLTGTGTDHEYGIHVRYTKSGTVGVAVASLSSDVEIDHVEISNCGFAGIMAKTDPNCDKPETWRRNGYVLRNLKIHHNLIHHTGGEGMYIGYTGGYKISSKNVCNEEQVFGHWLENVEIHHNLLEQTGWDGIQVNLVRENCKIYNNSIIGYGVAQEKYQNFGFSLGGGDIQLYNNFVENVEENVANGSMGMQMIGATSGSYIVGNLFINSHGYGIFIHNRYEFEEAEGYYIVNNTVVNPGQSTDQPRSGIMYNACITLSEDTTLVGYCQEGVNSYFYNNLIINPGADYASMNFWKKENECFIDFNTKTLRDSALENMSHNIFSRMPDTLGLLSNYEIADTASHLYNTGFDVSHLPIPQSDGNGTARPQYGFTDVGAFEYSLSRRVHSPSDEGTINVYPNPVAEILMLSESGFAGIKIINNLGVDVSSQTKILQAESSTEIEVKSLPSGIYYILAEGRQAVFVKK